MLSERNLRAVDEINTFLTRKPIAFVGAGMTRPHYLGWSELLARLSVELGIALDPALDPITQAEKFYVGNRAGYEACLRAIYGPMPVGCRPGLKELVKLNLAAFLTTNYDYSIYHAFMLNGGDPPVCLCYPSLSVSLCQKSRHIMFVHGAVENGHIADLDNFILHETSYLRAYFKDGVSGSGPLMTFLFDVFNQNDILFIGYGLGADEPLRFALRAAQMSLGGAKSRLMLVPAPLTTERIENYKYQFGIDLVEYDKVDANHSGLDEIIQHVSRTRVITPPVFGSPLSTVTPSLWRTTP